MNKVIANVSRVLSSNAFIFLIKPGTLHPDGTYPEELELRQQMRHQRQMEQPHQQQHQEHHLELQQRQTKYRTSRLLVAWILMV